jgi:hypothetical protein
VKSGFSAVTCFGIAVPVELWISAESIDTVAATGTAVAADSRMIRHAILPAPVAASDRFANLETSAVPGTGTAGSPSSPGFDRMRIGIAAKIDLAASVNSDCAEPVATHSDTLDPSCVLHSGSRNDLH